MKTNSDNLKNPCPIVKGQASDTGGGKSNREDVPNVENHSEHVAVSDCPAPPCCASDSINKGLSSEVIEGLEILRSQISKLQQEEGEYFKDGCHLLGIGEDSLKANWVWDYLFNDSCLETLVENL